MSPTATATVVTTSDSALTLSDNDRHRRQGRAVGALYLAIALIAPFSMIFVPSTLVADDAAGVLAKLLEHEALFRAGALANLAIVLLEVGLTALLLQFTRRVHESVAITTAWFRLAMTVLQAVNVGVSLVTLRLAHLADTSAAAELTSTALLVHGDLVLVWQTLFGLHCLGLGFLVWRAAHVPRIFGGLLVVAAIGYFSDAVGRLIFPGYVDVAGGIVGLTSMVGEVPFLLWLLIKGSRDTSTTAVRP